MSDRAGRDGRDQHVVARAAYGFELDRRTFFQWLGSGLLVCAGSKASLGRVGVQEDSEEPLPSGIESWLHIGDNGVVTVYTGKAEMGQNIRTSLAQQVAEELRAPFSSIRLVMGDTELTPYDAGTFGSRTTPYMGPQLRNAAAAAREMLVQMAAARWHVNASSLVAGEGRVADEGRGRSLSYAEIARGHKITALVPDHPALTPPTRWHVAGSSPAKVDAAAFVTGAHKYTSDIARPGMLRGKVLRPTAFNAVLAKLDSGAAEQMPGVKVVRDGNFVGVAAADEKSAASAVEALRAEWRAPDQPSSKELFDYLRRNVDRSQEGAVYESGSAAAAIASAEHKLSAVYTISYIAHAPLEPRAAVAEWSQGNLTVWTGTQRPFAVRDELAEAFRIPRAKVRVIVPDTGSAYGGKHTGEAAVEAARLARAVERPVKLVWSREEEFTWAYFRPAGVIEVNSGTSKDGRLAGWGFTNYNSGPAAIRTPYDVANQRIEFLPVRAPLRQGSYRSLAAAANHFARESHMDEIAHQAGLDPLEFRLKNLSDPRLRAVFEAAAKRFGWGREKSSPTRGFGLAGGVEKGGYVATCAEVEIEAGGRVRVRRVVEAFECGAVVNPEGLRNQIAGAVVQGLGGALFEATEFENGRILNARFSEYRVPRFADTPQIEVEIVNRKDLPSAGAGETPLVGIAPAVANAVFMATGTRLRSLPMLSGALPRAGET